MSHWPSAQGLPTRAQLGEEWAAVAAHTQRLAKLPQGTGGLLSLAAAGLAVRLKVWALLAHTESIHMRSMATDVLHTLMHHDGGLSSMHIEGFTDGREGQPQSPRT